MTGGRRSVTIARELEALHNSLMGQWVAVRRLALMEEEALSSLPSPHGS